MGLGDRLLQPLHRVAAAVDDGSAAPRSRRLRHLRGGHALNAGVGHCAVGVVDEGLTPEPGRGTRSRIQSIRLVISVVLFCVCCGAGRRLSGELVTTLWTRRRREKRGQNPSLRDLHAGIVAGSPLGD